MVVPFGVCGCACLWVALFCFGLPSPRVGLARRRRSPAVFYTPSPLLPFVLTALSFPFRWPGVVCSWDARVRVVDSAWSPVWVWWWAAFGGAGFFLGLLVMHGGAALVTGRGTFVL